MAERKSREQEEFELRLRTERRYYKNLDDIAWKHEIFLPALDGFKQGKKKINPSVGLLELIKEEDELIEEGDYASQSSN